MPTRSYGCWGLAEPLRPARTAPGQALYLHIPPDVALIGWGRESKGQSELDRLVAWSRGALIMSSGMMKEELTCPICLDWFSAVVETDCGHAFCCPCLLQVIRSAADDA